MSTNTDLDATPDELTVLKQRARMMGIQVSNNIGLETLREKIRAKQEGEVPPASTSEANPLEAVSEPAVKQMTIREYLHKENMKLVRIRVTNMDPKKKDLPGEIFTIANEYLGTVSKYVPYGETTDNGYHVPYCIFQMMQDRRFLNIRTLKGKGGIPRIEQTWSKEFALEVLPPLTKEDLDRLATAQAAAGSID